MAALVAVAMLLGAFVVPGPAAAGDNGQLHRCGYPGYYASSATIELPPGYWAVGEHSNSIHFVDPSWGTDDTWGPWTFTVSESAPLYPGQVIVAAGLITAGWTPVPGQTINPAQDTVMWAGWALWRGDYPNVTAMHEDLEDASILFSWDGRDEVLAHQGPLTSTCTWSLFAMFHRSYGPIVRP